MMSLCEELDSGASLSAAAAVRETIIIIIIYKKELSF